MEEDAGVYDAGKGSLENLTKQRIDLVMEQLVGNRSNQKSGGSSYRGMRPLGPPGAGDERKEKRGGETGGEEQLAAGYPREKESGF